MTETHLGPLEMALENTQKPSISKDENVFSLRQHSLKHEENGGINPLFYPRKVCLQLDHFEFEKKTPTPATSTPRRIAFCYRDERQIRMAEPYNGKVKFNLSYHSLMFDVIKVNLLKSSALLPQSHVKYAQASIKLSELDSFKDGAHVITFPLVLYSNKEKKIGSISILLQFYDFLVLDYSLFFSKPMTYDPEEVLQGGQPSPLLSQASSSSNGVSSDDTANNQPEFNDQDGEFFSGAASTTSNSYSNSNCSSSLVSFGEVASTWKEDYSLVQQLRSHSLSTISSESTQLGLADFKSLVAGLFATGWKLSASDIPRAFGLMGRYYRTYTTPKSGQVITEISHLLTAKHFLHFMMPVYGPLARKFFGHGSSADMIKKGRTVAIQHLFIPDNHMLAWEYSAAAITDAKPSFYIFYDATMNAVHVCVRGTWSMQDVFTDINCEFAPFIGGLAHRGILQNALWARDNYYEKIKGWIREFGADRLYLTGHSLGGSIVSILLMLIQDDLRQELGVECKVYSFAPAPCVSPDLIAEYQPYIESYINKHDPVPTLSYGAVMDLKEMLVYAAKLSKESTSKESQLSSLYKFAAQLRQSNKHPRLLVPGQIHFMYKTKEEGYVVEKSIPEHFDHVHLKADMMYHHIPPIYENSLKKAINQLMAST